MGIFARVRERVPFIKFLVNAQKTGWYPAFLAVLCFMSGISGYTVYVPMLWLLLLFHLFSVLFTDDKKVFLTSLLMMYFALGQDNISSSFYDSNGEMLSNMDARALPHLIAICTVGVAALVARLVIDGSLWRVLKRRRGFTFGIIAMDAAFILNGVFGADQSIENFGFGAFLAMGFTVVYLVVSAMIEDSSDPATYACQVTMSVSYAALAQILYVIYEHISNGKSVINIGNGAPMLINKLLITLGWGVSSVIAGIIILGIPAAMYLARRKKCSWFYFFSCLLFVAITVLMNTRGPMVIAIAVFVFCAAASCFKCQTKKYIRIYSAVLCGLILLFVAYLYCNSFPFEKILNALRLGQTSGESTRVSLLQNGIDDFTSSPIFGIGFANGGCAEGQTPNNFYSAMYHCILIELPAAMGIFGCIAFLVHLFDMARVLVKGFSADKLILLMLPIMIIGMSLLDNMFFYLNFQLFYGTFMALVDKPVDARQTSIQKDPCL